jgi:hypothetical protein
MATLKAGLSEARGNRGVRNALLLTAVVTAIWGGLEEYIPLLSAATGVSTPLVPMLVLVVSAGVTLGSLAAGRAERLSPRVFAALLALGTVVMGVGALLGTPFAFVLVAAGFGVFQLSSVLADAKLQDRITGPSRATVTSLAGLGMSVATAGVYGAYGVLSADLDHGAVFTLLAMPYLAVAAVMAYGSRTRRREQRDHH